MLLRLLVLAIFISSNEGYSWNAKEHAEGLLKTANDVFFSDRYDCRKYYRAFRVAGLVFTKEFLCPAKTHFDDATKACAMGSDCEPIDHKVKCLHHDQYLADPNNCAAFYHCSLGAAYRKCCPKHTAWNQKTTRCDYIASCTDEPDCEQGDQATLTEDDVSCVRGDYRYSQVAGSPTQYTQTNTDTNVTENASCPKDHVFVMSQCACINQLQNADAVHDPENDCVKLNFDDGFSSDEVWVQEKSATRTDGKACLQGAGFLKIPYLNNYDLGSEFQFGFTFTSDGKDASLFTNGDQQNPASLDIQIKDGDVIFKMLTDRSQSTLKLKASDGEVKINYDGAKLALKIGDKESSTTATGKFSYRPHDMVVGQGLNGCIDNIIVIPTVPELMHMAVIDRAMRTLMLAH